MPDPCVSARVPKKQRSRPCFVCANCRRRKVGCDKLHPCTRCVKSNIADTCAYITSPSDQGTNSPTLFTIPFINDERNNFEEYIPPLNSTYTLLESENHDLRSKRLKNKLFNYKSRVFKKALFSEDQDHNVTYYSPLTYDAIFDNNKPFAKFQSMFPYLEDLKEEVRSRKEMKEISSREIMILSTVFHEAEILGFINNYLIPNLLAINERILFFDSDLKIGPFNSFLPVITIYNKFNECFMEDNGIIRFKNKKLVSDYAIVASALAIVRVVVLSTCHDNNVTFNTQLTIEYDTLSDSILRFLSISSFRTKPTFDALLAIMIFRTSYFICDFVSVNSNAKLFFELAIEMCFKLGIHVKCTAINGYTEEEVITVWNNLQFIDGAVSIHTGEMLKIDYKYCVPNLYNYWEPMVLYVRRLSDMFLDANPISINEMLEMVDSAAKLLTIFKPFEDILNDKQYGPVQYMFSLVMKCNFIMWYQLLLFKLRLNIDELYHFPFDICRADVEIISSIKLKIEILLFNSFFLTFEILKKIANEDIPMKQQSMKVMLMMKLIFSSFINAGNKIIFCQLSIFAKDRQVYFHQQKQQNYKSIGILESETFMIGEIDKIRTDDLVFQYMASYRNSISEISSYLMDFYSAFCNKNVLLLGGTLALNFKMMLFICSLIKNVLDYKHDMQIKNPSFDFQLSDWKYVVDKTTFLVSSQNLGTVDNTPAEKENALLSQKQNAWAFLQDEKFKGTLDEMAPVLISDDKSLSDLTSEEAEFYSIFFS